MRKLTVLVGIPAFALVLCVLVPALVYGAAEEFVEDFSTKLYCDVLNTTAQWDTVAGELKLPPFQLSVVGSRGGFSAVDVAISGNYAYVVYSLGLKVVDITNPASPVVVATYSVSGMAWDVEVSGNYAYLLETIFGMLYVIDITNPASPSFAGSYAIDIGDQAGIAISGNYAYLAAAEDGLLVLNITNPASPVLAGSYATSGRAHHVTVSGNYAYVWDTTSGLLVLDITNPASPTLAGTCAEANGTVVISGDYGYAAGHDLGLQVLDITNPASPVLVGSCDTPDNACQVAVSGDYAYVADFESGIQVIDITNPSSPAIVGGYDPVYYVYRIAVAGDLAYVANYTGGLLVMDIADATGQAPTAAYDTPGTAYGCAVAGDYAYVADYASGLQVVDVTDPTVPSSAGSYNTPGSALGVAVDGDHAFVADGTSGLQVLSISDPTTPTLAGSYDSPGEAYGVVVDGDYAFVADGSYGLRVVNVTNPSSPVSAGSYNTSGNTYGVAVDGDYAFLADGAEGLRVVNITNPASPSLLGSYNTTGDARGVSVAGDYVYVADGGSGVEVISVSNPSSPSLVGNYDTQGFAYGIAVAGDFAFVADGGEGFLVLDITNPASPALVGGFDTPGSAYGLAVDGDYVFLADGASGLAVVEVFQRAFQGGNNRGQSLVFASSANEISAVRFAPAQVDSIYWYASADSGVSWTYVPVDTFWHQIDVPGYGLGWRAELFSRGYHVNPTCTSVGIEWKYSPALIDTVLDVPEDEGGWARVRFESSGLDVASQGPSVVKHYYVHRRIDDIGFTEELKEKGERVEWPVLMALEPGLGTGTDAVTGAGTGSGQGTGVVAGEGAEPVGVWFPGADAYLLGGRYYFVSQLPVSGGLPPGAWEVVTGVPALQEYAYYSLAPTHADSMSTFEYTVYCVTAHTDVSTVYYVSPPDSGYSKDNLAPQPPADLKGDYSYPPAQLLLSWDRNRERDFSHYAVYKGDTPDFIPGLENCIGVPWDTSLVDEGFDPAVDSYYKVSAWDIHENEGEFSLLTPEDITHVETPPPVPVATTLEQNAPNPFNPATIIKFSVARAGWVTLRIYDVAGRGVRTLVGRVVGEGWYEEVWDGRDDGGRSVPSGVYVYELQAPLYREARKMVLLR